MRAIFPPPRAMVRVFVVLLLLQDVFCVRALARTTMVRVVLRVRSKFGERERVFIFLAAVWRLSRLFLFFSAFLSFFSLRVFLLLLLFGGWRRTHTTPQTTPRREKKEGEEEYCYRCGITHARPQSPRSRLLSLFQSVFV
jgi:hypothetical protein